MIRKLKTALLPAVTAFLVLAGYSSCSLNKTVIGGVADAISKGGGIAFTGEDDPELVGDALPFALKFYDSILEQVPDHQDLLLSTGSAYIMYANAYLQTPALMMGNSNLEKKDNLLKRAKKFYLRGRDMVLRALDVRHPGFMQALMKDDFSNAVAPMTVADVPFLYWAGASWMGAYSLNAFDINMSVGVKKAMVLMNRALELNESYNNGVLHDFFISFYGSMPQGMGGNDEKAKVHFDRAIEVSKGSNPWPYVSYATSLSVKNQNSKEFKDLMNQALRIDINKDITNRLSNIIAQRKAKWYLDHVEDFFIE